MKFSSRDRDNDLHGTTHCGEYNGGWWHRACNHIEFNDDYSAIRMYLNGESVYPSFAEMKIRPQECNIS